MWYAPHEDCEDNDERQQWCTSRSEEVVVQGCTIIYLREGRLKSRPLSSLKGMRTCIILSFSFPIFLISVHPNHDRDGWIISAHLCANEEDGGGAAHRLHIFINLANVVNTNPGLDEAGFYINLTSPSSSTSFPARAPTASTRHPATSTGRRQLQQLYI